MVTVQGTRCGRALPVTLLARHMDVSVTKAAQLSSFLELEYFRFAQFVTLSGLFGLVLAFSTAIIFHEMAVPAKAC